jgi:hypothetical protein
MIQRSYLRRFFNQLTALSALLAVVEAQVQSSHIILRVHSQADRLGYEAREAVGTARIRHVNRLTPLDDLSFENTVVTTSHGSLGDKTPLDLYSTL